LRDVSAAASLVVPLSLLLHRTKGHIQREKSIKVGSLTHGTTLLYHAFHAT